MPIPPNDTPNPDLLSMEMEEDYEVITSEEVDRVLDGLDQLISATSSENIRSLLEEAADNIYLLVYGEEDASAEEDQEQDEAA